MRVPKTKSANTDARQKELDELQARAIQLIRENTEKMRKKVAEATQKCQLPMANA